MVGYANTTNNILISNKIVFMKIKFHHILL